MKYYILVEGQGNMPGLRDAVAEAAPTRMVHTPTLATIGTPIESIEATPASVIKPTGITILDRNLGGGIPSGSVVYLSADPKSMSEVFLYQFTQARSTYYFATGRRPKYIARDIQNMGYEITETTFVDIYSEYYIAEHGELVDNVGNEYVDTQVIEFMIYNLQNIQTEEESGDINIIIDTLSFFLGLNVNIGQIKKLMNVIYETTKETNGLTYLYGLKDTHDKALENEVINACDAVFDVELHRGADELVSKLAIPKIRGMSPVTEMLKFRVSGGIQIDTSTDIA